MARQVNSQIVESPHPLMEGTHLQSVKCSPKDDDDETAFRIIFHPSSAINMQVVNEVTGDIEPFGETSWLEVCVLRNDADQPDNDPHKEEVKLGNHSELESSNIIYDRISARYYGCDLPGAGIVPEFIIQKRRRIFIRYFIPSPPAQSVLSTNGNKHRILMPAGFKFVVAPLRVKPLKWVLNYNDDPHKIKSLTMPENTRADYNLSNNPYLFAMETASVLLRLVIAVTDNRVVENVTGILLLLCNSEYGWFLLTSSMRDLLIEVSPSRYQVYVTALVWSFYPLPSFYCKRAINILEDYFILKPNNLIQLSSLFCFVRFK